MMPLLQKVIFLKRYKRFLVDIEQEGNITTVHCPNSGSMKGLTNPGSNAWISTALNPMRKLKHTLEIIESERSLVGVNTHRTNKIVLEALQAKKIDHLDDYDHIQAEVPYGTNSRIDFLLKKSGSKDTYIEVKNVTLKNGNHALFPDAPTLRGTKHLLELIKIKAEGHRAIMLYVVQRQDCQKFSIAKDIDPLYCKTLKKAIEGGVEILAYQCRVTPANICLDKPILIDLEFTEA